VSQIEAKKKPKSPSRLDRRMFWTWAIPLLVAHGIFSIAMTKGVAGPFGPLDNILIILLAIALAYRFRDIGWPVWIGPTFLIGTMIVLPFAALGYAFASHPAPPELLQWLTRIGQIAGPSNLALVIVAGCVPGRPITAESV
jgi:hypothetical protein